MLTIRTAGREARCKNDQDAEKGQQDGAHGVADDHREPPVEPVGQRPGGQLQAYRVIGCAVPATPASTGEQVSAKIEQRVREQNLIDYFGGAKSMGGSAGNAIQGISDFNILRQIYMNAARRAFGLLWGAMPQFTPGALFRIPVEDDHAYALMLSKPGYVAFYGKNVEFDEAGAPAGPPLFTVLVTDPTYSGRKWGKPVRMVSADELPRIPNFFRQTATGANLRIVDPEAGRAVSARREDLEGLEQEGAWTADHIESRILDTYAGRPNLFAESLKPRL